MARKIELERVIAPILIDADSQPNQPRVLLPDLRLSRSKTAYPRFPLIRLSEVSERRPGWIQHCLQKQIESWFGTWADVDTFCASRRWGRLQGRKKQDAESKSRSIIIGAVCFKVTNAGDLKRDGWSWQELSDEVIELPGHGHLMNLLNDVLGGLAYSGGRFIKCAIDPRDLDF